MAVHVLLVGPDAESLGEALGTLLDVDVTTAATATAARAHLSGTAFDAVAARADLDGLASVAEVAEALGVPHGVLAYGPGDDLAAVLASRLSLTARTDRAPGPDPAGRDAPDDMREALAALRVEIGIVAHDLANPLAVVVGNAQLGAELVRALALDAALGDAFADIEEAGQELARRIGRLASLQARLDALL